MGMIQVRQARAVPCYDMVPSTPGHPSNARDVREAPTGQHRHCYTSTAATLGHRQDACSEIGTSFRTPYIDLIPSINHFLLMVTRSMPHTSLGQKRNAVAVHVAAHNGTELADIQRLHLPYQVMSAGRTQGVSHQPSRLGAIWRRGSFLLNAGMSEYRNYKVDASKEGCSGVSEGRGACGVKNGTLVAFKTVC